MRGWISLSDKIDWFTRNVGKSVAWCIVAAVLISATNAIIRKVFHVSSNAWLEMQWLLFGAVFMLCAAWTLQDDAHIRIDIVNSRLKKHWRNGIDMMGHVLFLAPFVCVMLYVTYPFFMRSFIENDGSTNAGGLVVWPGKFIILLGFVLLGLQCISEIIKRIAIMRGLKDDPNDEKEDELYIPEIEPR